MRETICPLSSNAPFFNDPPTGERPLMTERKPDPNGYRFCVRDNGIGIDPRYTDQIFDLGLKLDKSRGGGPGYGLYLAKRVIESHGGTISVDTALDQGSAFCFTIPR
jgi:signal transduction histidine kinase